MRVAASRFRVDGVTDGFPPFPWQGRGFYVVSGGATSQHTHAHVLQALHERGFRVDVTDVTNRIGVLSVQGPNSRELLQGLVDVDLDDGSFPMSTSRMVKIAGHRVRALRLSFVGELGWELHIPVESCQAVYKAVRAAGQRHDLRMAGYRAMYSLSAEKVWTSLATWSHLVSPAHAICFVLRALAFPPAGLPPVAF